MTALMYAAWQDSPNPRIMDALLRFGSNVNEKDESRKTALMYAAGDGQMSEVIYTLSRAGADVNVQDKEGKTALMYAASDNVPTIVGALLDVGANTGIRNKQGKRAVNYARKNRKLTDSEALKRLENGSR